MKKLAFILLFWPFSCFGQTPEILWWFDVDDRCVGQTSMADINNDGYRDLVFGCFRNDSMIYALSGFDGSLLWKYNTSGWQEGCNDAAPLIYDFDGDGNIDVFLASSCHAEAYLFDGATGAVKWQTYTNGRGSDSPPTFGDLNGDGNMEILFGQMGGWVMSLNPIDGSINWDLHVSSNAWIQTAPTLVDLTGNGNPDFVVATWHFEDNNKVYAFKGEDRSLLWSVDINDVVYHGTAVSDLTGNGIPELVLGDYSGTLYCINGYDGSVLWTYEAPFFIGAPAVIGDITGDGHCEIVFSSSYKHYALKSDGTLLWQYDTPNSGWSFRGAALADITNNNLPEVIFGTNKGNLIALNGTDGTVLWIVDLAEHYGEDFDINHAPVIGDFNNNGFLDVFVVGGKSFAEMENNYGRAYAIQVGMGTGPEWPLFQNNIRRTASLCDDIPTKAKIFKEIMDLHIFPNPIKSGEYLYINISKITENPIVKIANISGRILYSQKIEHNVIKIQLNIEAGVYFATVENDSDIYNARKIVIY